jgi:phospholipid/cholesterol/gamma-HCH transport system substrate-binding protein
MKRFNLEVTVGLFVVLGLCASGVSSRYVSASSDRPGNTYDLIAVFPTVAGLREGASVEIAGSRSGVCRISRWPIMPLP